MTATTTAPQVSPTVRVEQVFEQSYAQDTTTRPEGHNLDPQLAPAATDAGDTGRTTFVTTPPTHMDLARRIGLTLAVLTTETDPDLARTRAIQVLLTGCTDDAVELS